MSSRGRGAMDEDGRLAGGRSPSPCTPAGRGSRHRDRRPHDAHPGFPFCRPRRVAHLPRAPGASPGGRAPCTPPPAPRRRTGWHPSPCPRRRTSCSCLRGSAARCGGSTAVTFPVVSDGSRAQTARAAEKRSRRHWQTRTWVVSTIGVRDVVFVAHAGRHRPGAAGLTAAEPAAPGAGDALLVIHDSQGRGRRPYSACAILQNDCGARGRF